LREVLESFPGRPTTYLGRGGRVSHREEEEEEKEEEAEKYGRMGGWRWREVEGGGGRWREVEVEGGVVMVT